MAPGEVNGAFHVTLESVNKAEAKQPANGHTTSFTKQSAECEVSIIGTGDFGRALASRCKKYGIRYWIGTRYPVLKTNLLSIEEALEKSEVVFLCVPAHAHYGIAQTYAEKMRGKIVVDVSNSSNESPALALQKQLPPSHVFKALNTVSAYALEQNTHCGETYVCGDSETNKKRLIEILRKMALRPLDYGALSSAERAEGMNRRLFPQWRYAIMITFLVLVPILFYVYFRFFWFEKHQEKNKDMLNKLPLYEFNIVIAWLASTLLVLTYLPNAIAGYPFYVANLRFIQLCRGTKYKQFPAWLDRWLKCRKQLGLITLMLASMHLCASAFLIGGGELPHFTTTVYISNANGGPPHQLEHGLKWDTQLALLFAILTYTLMCILGITSLPSVGATMSWREWRFVQSSLGFLCLVFSWGHIISIGWEFWSADYIWGWKLWKKDPRGIYPNPVFAMTILPILVIVLKLLLCLPGVSCRLRDIRAGRLGAHYSRHIITA